MPVEGRGLSSRQTQQAARGREIGKPNNSETWNARTLACVGNRLSSPKVRHCHDRAWSPPRADDLDRPTPLHDDPIALSISAPHRVAARLVVGPDDVLDVGVGNE